MGPPLDENDSEGVVTAAAENREKDQVEGQSPQEDEAAQQPSEMQLSERTAPVVPRRARREEDVEDPASFFAIEKDPAPAALLAHGAGADHSVLSGPKNIRVDNFNRARGRNCNKDKSSFLNDGKDHDDDEDAACSAADQGLVEGASDQPSVEGVETGSEDQPPLEGASSGSDQPSVEGASGAETVRKEEVV